MGFETHAALLAYWREKRELLHALRVMLHGKNAQQVEKMICRVPPSSTSRRSRPGSCSTF